jgi:hypothetical protein
MTAYVAGERVHHYLVQPLPARTATPVSIVMPVLNEERHLADALRAVLDLEYDGDLDRREPPSVAHRTPSTARSGPAAIPTSSASTRTAYSRPAMSATSSPLGIGGSKFHVGGEPGPARTVYLGAFRCEVLDRLAPAGDLSASTYRQGAHPAVQGLGAVAPPDRRRAP